MINKRQIIILVAVVLLLLIPFIAMEFTDEVIWTIFDFVVMGSLLLITGFLCEYVLRKVNKKERRIALCFVILVAFLLLWAELAVGIFGTPISGK